MSRPVDYAALVEKTCIVCQATLPVSEFNRYTDPNAVLTGWRYYSQCKSCNKAESREYGVNNREKRNARLKAWRKANPEKAAALDRRKRLLSEHGLKEADLTRLVGEQRGKCWLCQQDASLLVNHCPKTGQVRGLLCHPCNAGVHWVERNPTMLKRLEAFRAAPFHADTFLKIANTDG